MFEAAVDISELMNIELEKLVEWLEVEVGGSVELKRVRTGTSLELNSVELLAAADNEEDVVEIPNIEVAIPKIVSVAWNSAQEYPSYCRRDDASQKPYLMQYGACEVHDKQNEPTQVSGAYNPTQVVYSSQTFWSSQQPCRLPTNVQIEVTPEQMGAWIFE